MKAAVYDVEGAPGVLKYADVPEPVTGPDDILISVEAISIEGGDLINRRSTPPPLPLWIGGYAAAGTVVAVGSKVRSRTVGDRVAAFHMQDRMRNVGLCPRNARLIPDGVGMAEAAALPISFGTAHHCLFTRGMLRQGETVLIHAAAGGVGLAAVQLASQAGATVIAVVSGTQRRGRLRELGADYVVDRTKDNIVDSVRQYTHGTGVDLVIDPVGTTLPVSLSALAPEGRMVFVGNAGGGSLTVDLWPAMQSNQTLMGVFMGPLFARQGVRTSVDEMLQAVAAGRVTVVIDRIFLANAAAAHEFAETAKPLGRIVMKP